MAMDCLGPVHKVIALKTHLGSQLARLGFGDVALIKDWSMTQPSRLTGLNFWG